MRVGLSSVLIDANKCKGEGHVAAGWGWTHLEREQY